MKLLFFLLFTLPFLTFSKPESISSVSALALVDSSQRRENPVIPGDFADPSIIRVGQTYYATGTSSEWAPHFPLLQSTDLLHWKPIGYVFPKTPAWAAASFWAPELYYRNGTYFVYYVARKKSDGISCIGVATSRNLAKGFTDRGILLEFGKEAIDPFVIEDKGQLYITWKAYGLDQRPIEILGSRLSNDGLKVQGEPFMLLRDDKKEGLEGQALIKRDNAYYLFYSPGNCCGRDCNYKVEVARSASLQGPYTRFEGNPLLAETDEWKCTGHGTLVTSPAGKTYYLYHAYNKKDLVYTGRQGMLGEVVWDAEWPRIKPLGNDAERVKNFRDDFSATTVSGSWQWDFRHATPEVKVSKGNLFLTGQSLANNLSGTALTIRPLLGDYTMTTEVVNQNAALKGLVLYGDAGQAVGIGMQGNQVQIWEVKKDQRQILRQESIASAKAVQLKMDVKEGSRLRFYWSPDGKKWNELTTTSGVYDGSFLPPWDRSPRPGLLHQGASGEPAVFSFFALSYQ
ncbi:beta-xylosidase [Siphonobacter sp. BAB-5405]|uniref:glycoside hydrolase family 43 protein n=1 Tax=Siphonobacter sp. BAB-5405 TaxID=1864825 RepID=UPI000C80C351|nr:family 43 glycosylhydrolase [Siphonobacter sp. BAB-5405]PMD92438.1 beta-xylosidase [Siphonobacter sp. BAB-5405]